MQANSSTESQREYFRQYALKHKDKIKAYQAEYRQRNLGKLNAASRAWHHANKEAAAIKKKEYYEANKERLKANAREYGRAHADESRARVAAWVKANPEQNADTRRKASKRRYDKDPEKYNARFRAWRAANLEAQRERTREWNRDNKGKIRAYYEANKDAIRERAAEYHKEHPHLARITQSRRRARMMGAGGSHTENDVLVLYDQQCGCCVACEKELNGKYEVDHIMPIFLGGSDNPENLQLLCRRCNRSKGHKHPDDWRRELELKKAS